MRKVNKVLPVLLVSRVFLVPVVLQEKLANPVKEVLLVTLDLLVLLELEVNVVPLVKVVLLALLDLWEPVAHLELLDPMDKRESPVLVV